MRKKLVIYLFEISKNIYTKYFKQDHIPWNVTVPELLTYPIQSFGYALGDFLNDHQFDLIAKVERHDAYHVLTGYGTSVEEEIGLQYLCMGNGKKSVYMYGTIVLGTFILPEYYSFYYTSYRIGKEANPFHQFDYLKLLQTDYSDLYHVIFLKNLDQVKQENLHGIQLVNSSYIPFKL
ncbi:hypothetical protein NBRC110019_26420 [Neptunitalea chrysea]|uniref:Coenzyme Q (Ubiquinone) biosynthesis protein Coq4 n=1 Tax=Neptunitalea chrysea TaxID=1647581 RepID=A0A9W6EW02_9FLAO|nr:Coq4 family protein [Neptunitalea chrysea]GLB53601.1 hypothetical protein NBRC110019_26420 [Neptunitalea chrysea]